MDADCHKNGVGLPDKSTPFFRLLVFTQRQRIAAFLGQLDENKGHSFESKTASRATVIAGAVPTSEDSSGEHPQPVSLDRRDSPSRTAARRGGLRSASGSGVW